MRRTNLTILSIGLSFETRLKNLGQSSLPPLEASFRLHSQSAIVPSTSTITKSFALSPYFGELQSIIPWKRAILSITARPTRLVPCRRRSLWTQTSRGVSISKTSLSTPRDLARLIQTSLTLEERLVLSMTTESPEERAFLALSRATFFMAFSSGRLNFHPSP